MTKQKLILMVEVHEEAGSFWAEVLEYPGVFATGDNVAELIESVREGVELVLGYGVKVTNIEAGTERVEQVKALAPGAQTSDEEAASSVEHRQLELTAC